MRDGLECHLHVLNLEGHEEKKTAHEAGIKSQSHRRLAKSVDPNVRIGSMASQVIMNTLDHPLGVYIRQQRLEC